MTQHVLCFRAQRSEGPARKARTRAEERISLAKTTRPLPTAPIRERRDRSYPCKKPVKGVGNNAHKTVLETDFQSRCTTVQQVASSSMSALLLCSNATNPVLGINCTRQEPHDRGESLAMDPVIWNAIWRCTVGRGAESTVQNMPNVGANMSKFGARFISARMDLLTFL